MTDFDEIQKEIDRDRRVDIIKELCLYAFFLGVWCFAAVKACQWVMDWMMSIRFKLSGGGF